VLLLPNLVDYFVEFSLFKRRDVLGALPPSHESFVAEEEPTPGKLLVGEQGLKVVMQGEDEGPSHLEVLRLPKLKVAHHFARVVEPV
jgi:hypothetical protein